MLARRSEAEEGRMLAHSCEAEELKIENVCQKERGGGLFQCFVKQIYEIFCWGSNEG